MAQASVIKRHVLNFLSFGDLSILEIDLDADSISVAFFHAAKK